MGADKKKKDFSEKPKPKHKWTADEKAVVATLAATKSNGFNGITKNDKVKLCEKLGLSRTQINTHLRPKIRKTESKENVIKNGNEGDKTEKDVVEKIETTEEEKEEIEDNGVHEDDDEEEESEDDKEEDKDDDEEEEIVWVDIPSGLQTAVVNGPNGTRRVGFKFKDEQNMTSLEGVTLRIKRDAKQGKTPLLLQKLESTEFQEFQEEMLNRPRTKKLKIVDNKEMNPEEEQHVKIKEMEEEISKLKQEKEEQVEKEKKENEKQQEMEKEISELKEKSKDQVKMIDEKNEELQGMETEISKNREWQKNLQTVFEQLPKQIRAGNEVEKQ